MFETINTIWLDLNNNCRWERSHQWDFGNGIYKSKRDEDGCKVVIYRRSGQQLGIFDVPNMIDMPEVKLGDSLLNDLQLLAEWFRNKVNDCLKVDVTYRGNVVAYIESDTLPNNI